MHYLLETLNHIIKFFLENKVKLPAFVLFWMIICVIFVLLVNPQWRADASFEANNNWENWWRFYPYRMMEFDALPNKFLPQKNISNNVIATFKSMDISRNFLQSLDINEECYFSNKSNFNYEKHFQFLRNLSIGKDRLSDIHYISILEKNPSCAKLVLGNYIKYVNNFIVEKQLNLLASEAKALKENITDQPNFFVRQGLQEVIDENIARISMINENLTSPITVISKPATGMFRFFPIRGRTTLFFGFLAGFIYVLLFLPKIKN